MATKWIIQAEVTAENANGPHQCCGHEHRSYAAAVKCLRRNPGMTISRYDNDEQQDDVLPEYQTEYPSRFKKGTLGWVLDQETGVASVTHLRKRVIESQFHKIESAYLAGRKAGAVGLGKDANPYPDRPKTKSFSEREEWFRGWRAVRMDARQAARLSPING